MSPIRTQLDYRLPVMMAGTPLEQAAAAMILIHGRGATAQNILEIIPSLNCPNVAYLAPDTDSHTWYPNRFLAPLQDNEPSLSASLSIVEEVISSVINARLLPPRIVLLGFSQGACLILEYAARHAQRYGAVIGLTGALIGPDDLIRDDHGSLDNTPVFLGCGDDDPHVPRYRVEQSAEVLRSLGGVVTTRIYPGLPHTINPDELLFVRNLMLNLVAC